MSHRLLPIVLLAAVLAGCAAGNPAVGFGVQPGTSRDAVVARLGTPTRVVPLPQGGDRLQYSGQPFGPYAVMVDLDARGQVMQSRQVLTAREFQRIQPGSWSRGDVEREFGPPASVDRVASWDGPIMSYRWRADVDMFYWVYLDGGGVVRRSHPGMDMARDWERD